MISRPKEIISTLSMESIGTWISTSTPGASAWSAANRAIFLPFRIDYPIMVVKLFCLNGSPVSGNIDMGIYTMDGTRIVSNGSTPHTGANIIQEFDISNTLLGPGAYMLAGSMDNNTGVLFRRSINVNFVRISGGFVMASAFPLPATATFEIYAGTNFLPLLGLSTKSLI